MDTQEQDKQDKTTHLKRVRWEESVSNHGESSSSSGGGVKRLKESFNPVEVITNLNNLFIKKDYINANYYVVNFGDAHQEQILSADNYALFKKAALRSDLRTLQFIYDKVGNNLTKKMIEDHQYAALENFLTHECMLENDKTTRDNRIEIFKFFIIVGGEQIKNQIENKLSTFKISENNKNDLQQDLKEACTLPDKEAQISSSSSSSFVERYSRSSYSSSSLTIRK